MSQYQPALNYVLDWEDPKRRYVPVPDVGGFAISGVNSTKWPSDYASIKSATSNRPQLIYDFYQNRFWNPMKVGGIDYQDLANRILDAGVNVGGETSIKLLQICAGVKDDGVLGPETFAAVNDQDPDKIIALFRQQRFLHYKRIVDINPQDSKFLDEWDKRALA